jgi:hypothetical protein
MLAWLHDTRLLAVVYRVSRGSVGRRNLACRARSVRPDTDLIRVRKPLTASAAVAMLDVSDGTS